ncbi:uncharacterized protein LAESUDRAFT_246429 [Laetiporus sulphureus 93-53]|uniref:Uncharacterized protein n=1 Tax=Laetiporus sulphureus 93-53 TaxID=1314785 RepID=A0A165DHQ8_9APHY|nr:uncharacterized protein LAESUDRAFT_246429 [Laetiporus sulphureus 93-53]KZT04904.1 hypothetical protein LAESUDRAFT_246429 [Laetiporus sulphureus 93-53]
MRRSWCIGSAIALNTAIPTICTSRLPQRGRASESLHLSCLDGSIRATSFFLSPLTYSRPMIQVTASTYHRLASDEVSCIHSFADDIHGAKLLKRILGTANFACLALGNHRHDLQGRIPRTLLPAMAADDS